MKRVLFVFLMALSASCGSEPKQERRAYVCGVEYLNGDEGIVSFISDTAPQLIDGCLRNRDKVEACGVRCFNVATFPLQKP